MASRIIIQPKYNKWTVLEEVEKTTARNFLCKCDCGNTSIVRIDMLTKGKSTGCRNCANKHKEHGDYKTRLYKIWMGMINRCNLKADYKDIPITEEWRQYIPFRDWALANGYEDTLTLDRQDVYGGYCVENCRWVTIQVQSENKKLINRQNTSGYKGVSFHKASSRWRASISLNNKKKHLGFFETKEQAALSYNNYVIENSLVERKLNIIPKGNP